MYRVLSTLKPFSRFSFTAESPLLTPLAGDASNRRYFRVGTNGSTPASLILMQLAEPEAFKQSEEAVSGAAVQINELPFTNVLSHLAKAGVTVRRLSRLTSALTTVRRAAATSSPTTVHRRGVA